MRINLAAASHATPLGGTMQANLSKSRSRSALLYTASLIALLHAALLTSVLMLSSTPSVATRAILNRIIETQLIAPDATPISVPVEAPRATAPKRWLKTKPQVSQATQQTTTPLPLQAARRATPPTTTTPSPSTTAALKPAQSALVKAKQLATPTASPPKNVPHLECVISHPAYPKLSRRNEESGTVLVQIVIDTQGRIDTAKLAQSSSYARLDNAALQAAQNSRCQPYLENGAAIRASAAIPFRFMIDD